MLFNLREQPFHPADKAKLQLVNVELFVVKVRPHSISSGLYSFSSLRSIFPVESFEDKDEDDRFPQCNPSITRSRCTPSSCATLGKNAQHSKPRRSNNFKLRSLCPKIRPTSAVIPNDGARVIACCNNRWPTPRRRKFSST